MSQIVPLVLAEQLIPEPKLPGGAIVEQPALAASHRAVPPRTAEAELRLLASPETFAQLTHAPAIVAHARNKGTVRVVRAIYYDTPSGALRDAGVTLRVRQVGKGFVQTLHGRAGNGIEPPFRGEWETSVATAAPEFRFFGPLVSVGLQAALSREPLQPIFGAEMRRHVRDIELPTGSVQVAFERGIVTSDGRTAPICDVALELKRGSPAALYDLALALNELGDVRPTLRTAAERGYELALDLPPAVHKAGQPLPAVPMSLDEACSAILQSSLSQLLGNVAAAEDGRDAEGVHQLRVALRRLRSALALLKPLAPSPILEDLRTDARWLASRVAEARNWDVFLSETIGAVARGCGHLDGAAMVQEAAETCRAHAYSEVRSALAERRCGRFQLTLGGWIEQRGWRSDASADSLAVLASSARSFAAHILAKQHARLLKRARHFRHLPPELRHELRLTLKKHRYTLDFFLPLFERSASTKRYTRSLARLQDWLGRYNDAATTRDLVRRLPVDTLPSAGREAIGAVLGWQACLLACVEPDLRSAWREFRRADEPWNA
jgi:inorganic triphosphatase YgiF